MKIEYIQCGDCLANYPNGTLHICDPLMKALVQKRRDMWNNPGHTFSRHCNCKKCKTWFKNHTLAPNK